MKRSGLQFPVTLKISSPTIAKGECEENLFIKKKIDLCKEFLYFFSDHVTRKTVACKVLIIY